MSHRETLTLAHTAQCKLKLAVDKPDRDLRFIVGHALTLDTLTLRLIQIEKDSSTVKKPSHSSSVRFKAAGGDGIGRSPLSGRRKTPPPQTTGNVVHGVDEVLDDEYGEVEPKNESSDEELSLQRFTSGAARPPRYPQIEKSPPEAKKAKNYSASASSSDDEDLQTFLEQLERDLSKESLQKYTNSKSDEKLATLYNSVQKCPCHQTDAPEFENFWEIPKDQKSGDMKGFDSPMFVLAEVKV
jgi:hypothetical protein